MRTVFLSLPGSDWHSQLSEFYRTDVEVPGKLTVDGKPYQGVGVRYRGSSSYIMVSTLKKKSINISVDYTDESLRIDGNRTINFLNCNQDISLIRDAFFARIAGEYVPTPRVNFVKLVINGANWGAYANAQQFNKDFLKDWFGSRKAVRWKIERNFRGVGALRYLGEDKADYQRAFQLKTKNDPQAWSRLIRFCKLLNETPVEEREAVLPAVLDVDRTLWFLALEWVFEDSDGYVKQGYDYRLVELPDGRFLPILYDNNEILPRPIPNRPVARRQGQRGFGSDPLEQMDNDLRPLMSRLLAVPAWRARYLAHVRTVATHCLDWQKIGPVCQGFHDLITAEVKKDRRRLTTLTAFEGSLDELQMLCARRSRMVLAHPSLAGPRPEIAQPRVQAIGGGDSGQPARVQIDVGVVGEVPLAGVFLYYRWAPHAAFKRVAMREAGDRRFVGLSSELEDGEGLDFYIEARAPEDLDVTMFHPEAAEARPAHFAISK
ncbi:MAG: CotH kinase family protein [Planctomycetota bacterium]|nr:CotH kinase family protein [Planctomycetota bacterium]